MGASCVGGPRGITARWQARRVRDGAAAFGGLSRCALNHLTEGAPTRPTGITPPGGVAFPPLWTPRPAPTGIVFAVVGRIRKERGIDTRSMSSRDVRLSGA